MDRYQKSLVHYVVGPDVTVMLEPTYHTVEFHQGKGPGKLVLALTLESLENTVRKAREALNAGVRTRTDRGTEDAPG